MGGLEQLINDVRESLTNTAYPIAAIVQRQRKAKANTTTSLGLCLPVLLLGSLSILGVGIDSIECVI